MPDLPNPKEQIRHLIQYYRQAVHEFFDDISNEMLERIGAAETYFEKPEISAAEYRKVIEYLSNSQQGLAKKVGDLGFLIDRIGQLGREIE